MKCPKPHWINDNWCDDMNNIEACNWDGGDCCGANVNTKYCTDCQCLDPNFCEDDDQSYCEENFETHYSFCQKNPDYANKCKKTCGKCEGPCQDKLPVYRRVGLQIWLTFFWTHSHRTPRQSRAEKRAGVVCFLSAFKCVFWNPWHL